VEKSKQKDLNSMVILEAWALWLHRKRVFDSVTPSLATAQHSFKEELSLAASLVLTAQKLQELFFGRGEMLV
jgi:hypothetical protein